METQAVPRPRLGPLNLAFGLVLLAVGAWKTWESLKTAESTGTGEVQIFWAAIVLGFVLTLAGALQLILQRRS